MRESVYVYVNKDCGIKHSMPEGGGSGGIYIHVGDSLLDVPQSSGVGDIYMEMVNTHTKWLHVGNYKYSDLCILCVGSV